MLKSPLTSVLKETIESFKNWGRKRIWFQLISYLSLLFIKPVRSMLTGISLKRLAEKHIYFFSNEQSYHIEVALVNCDCEYLAYFELKKIQQGLEIHGLKEHGPWRYTVFGQKPWRCTVFLEIHGFWQKALKMHGF